MSNLDIWVNIANVFYLASFSVRDILWLRILSVTGALCLLPFYYLQATPLMTPIYWNLVFVSINVFWIVRLILERRPVQLDTEEQQLYQLAFRTLTPREAQKLFRLGTWRTADSGEILAKRDDELDSLSIILSGKASAEADGRIVAEVGEGQCVGQIAFFTDNNVSVADVTTTEPTRLITWPKSVIHKVTKSHPELGTAIRMAVGVDLSRILMKSWNPKTPDQE